MPGTENERSLEIKVAAAQAAAEALQCQQRQFPYSSARRPLQRNPGGYTEAGKPA